MTKTVHVIGVNHKSAPVEERERLVSGDDEVELGRGLLSVPGIDEVAVISTCNRVEVYMVGDKGIPSEARHFIAQNRHLGDDWLNRYAYQLTHEEALAHLFRVASSLDSLIIGEPQIVGQVKDAFAKAHDAGLTGPLLNRTFSQALRTAKRVRTETAVAENAVSVSYAAVELARKVFGDLSKRSVLIIGAGKMGGLALKSLIAAGVQTVHVANRSPERAREMATEVGGQGHGLEAIPKLLEQVDIVISSTGAQDYVIQASTVKSILPGRKYRPLFLIDIAVPRDIDPACEGLQNVYVFDVDDLEKVIQENMRARRREAERAEHIVDEEVQGLIGWMQQAVVVPTIVSLREKLTSLKESEVEKVLRESPMLDPEARRAIERLAHSLVNKILHEPTMSLRQASASGDHLALVTATRNLFDLHDEQELPPKKE